VKKTSFRNFGPPKICTFPQTGRQVSATAVACIDRKMIVCFLFAFCSFGS